MQCFSQRLWSAGPGASSLVLSQNEEPGTCAYASCARTKGQQPEGPGTKSSRSSLVTLMHWGQLIDGGSWHACRCRSRAETAMLRLLVLPVTIVAAKTRKCCKCFAAAFRGDYK